MKNLNILAFLLLMMFSYSCGPEKKEQKSEQLLIEEFDNQEFIAVKSYEIDSTIFDELGDTVITDSKQELTDDRLLAKDWPSIFRNRLYIDGLGDFKSDLTKLVGAIAIKNGNSYEIGVEQFFAEGVQPEVQIPGDGTLIFRSYNKKQSSALSFFLNINLSSDQLVQFSLKDTGTIVLGSSDLDIDRIIRTFKNHNNLDNLYLIRIAVSTAMTHKIFKERKRRIRVADFPSIPAGISAENKFYTSSLDYKQDFKVGVILTSVKTIIETTANESN